MKAIHKRVASGIQNSSLLQNIQNTQRIQLPKRSIEQKGTAKKQKTDEEMFNRILRETEMYQLYDAFVGFHADMEGLINQGSIQQMKNCCYQFKDLLADLCLEYRQNADENLREEQSQKIRELLQQVYCLRKKVSDLDRSLQFNSISSLQQLTNFNMSQNKLTINKPLFSQVNPSGSKQMRTDQDLSSNLVNEPIANLIQLKMITFELLSSYWKCLTFILPDQAQILLDQIKSAYQQQFSSTYYNSRKMTSFMDRIQSLSQMAKNCSNRISQTYNQNDQTMCA